MKKINIFLAVFIMLNISMITSLKAQWTNVPTTGIEGTCIVTKYFADGMDLYAFVKNAGVYKSTDNGDNWSLFNTGLPDNVAIVAFTATPTKIYVAADKNGIYESDKTTAGFAILGTVPVLSNNFTGLEYIKGSLYLGINGKGVYKCEISTATYTQLTSGLANNSKVMSLTTDSITGVGRRLYAGVEGDNGFYVKNDADDTWVQVSISNETTSANKAQVRSIFANQGKVILGGSASVRGLLYSGSTTDFVSYTFTKTETNLPLDQAIYAVALDGNTIYAANTRAVWKSTDITQPDITFSQVSNGLQSPRASTYDLIMTNTKLWAAESSGGYMSDNGGTLWTNKLNIPTTAATINGFKENAGKLYANTSSGIYESATGNGGDWVKLGNGLNGSVPQFGLAFGDLGTFATCDGALFKLNGNNWEPVTVAIGPRRYNHPIYGAMSDIAQFKNTTTGESRLFGSGYSSAGIYTYNGTNWVLYSTNTTTENSDGIYTSNASDSTGQIIARFFIYDQAENILFSYSKNRLQISRDFGDNWTWRMGTASATGYKINTGTATVRSATLKTIGEQKFLFMGSTRENAGWGMGKSEYAPDASNNIGTNWTNTSTINPNDVYDIINFENTPILVTRGATNKITNSVYISTDDGVTGKKLETAITATITNISCLGQFGDYVYLGTKTNEMQRYNVKEVPAFLATAPNVGSITTTTANLKATSSVQGKIYFVVVPKNATAPSASQIVEGKDAANGAPVAAGNAVAVSTVESTLPIEGLTQNTDYTVYTVAQSEAAVISNVVSIDFSSTSLTSVENANAILSVYPNPTKGIVTVNTNSGNTTLVKVFNVQGEEVISVSGKSTIKVDLSNQVQGVYIIKAGNTFFKTVKN